MGQEETEKQVDELEKANVLLSEGRHEQCLETLRAYWLKNPQDKKVIELASKLMKEADQAEISACLTILAQSASDGQKDHSGFDKVPEKVFEAGYKLIDIREFELAEMLLKIASSLAPDDPTVHYELAFAMMSQAKYAKAARHFELVRKIEEDFDTVLNLSACYSLSREFDKSKELIKRLEQLAVSEEEKYELQHRKYVLQRQEQLRKKSNLTVRDWLYVLYGTVLLYEPDEDDDQDQGSNPDKRVTESLKKIAATLMVLKGLLEGLRLAPEAIEFYSPTARPLSAIMARVFDLPLGHYQGPDRPDHALMLMDWAPEIIGPHKSFITNDKNRSIFCYGLPSNMPLPLIPDIVGHFRDGITLPWKGESRATLEESESDTDPEEAIPEILEKAFNLESDPEVLKVIHESISYYVDKREYLILGNDTNFPHRPEYSAEVPGRLRHGQIDVV